jgi:general secretion pathway protein D
MNITPSISKNRTVVLTVELITSQLTGESRFGSDIVQKREYKTEVSVANDATMVLGGIRLKSKQMVIRRFPILGYIPILGYFFQNRDMEDRVTDLYAFISPTVVTNEAEGRAVTESIGQSIPDFEGMLIDLDDLPAISVEESLFEAPEE